ncbi:hypothetical protein BDBG_01106 [Blastomyces gilchristii SLH14081]|uniref:Uncharacterized protein n=1 Tax=Blastomyces gilchristii (strain SLH14081) TaxID=559298 RepID=A0A179UBC4_BLAGS|nr:uncharacterized protein BDBG_01106 [Blastomyces gilchristii SLH14081]OAT04579.1 hypothetical protein BDBG_01106 [Blastomyces gilchristii SLH14081]
MAERAQQQSSVESRDNISLSSTGSTRPTSPVQATLIWELTAHGSVHCEKSTAGEAICIILSTNSLNLQPSRPVLDWTQSIHTALADSRPIMPFQQMYKPLSQEEVAYIWKRLEEYTRQLSHNSREPCNPLGLQARKTVESSSDNIRNAHVERLLW